MHKQNQSETERRALELKFAASMPAELLGDSSRLAHRVVELLDGRDPWDLTLRELVDLIREANKPPPPH